MSSGVIALPNVQIKVIDLSDPTTPTQVATLQPMSGSETMRALVTDERALLVSGREVYDVSDCENPVLKGEIQWPGVTPWPMGGYHDVRISHDGKKVYAGIFANEADLSDLDDTSTWKIRNFTCDLIAPKNGGTPAGSDQCQGAYSSLTSSNGPMGPTSTGTARGCTSGIRVSRRPVPRPCESSISRWTR